MSKRIFCIGTIHHQRQVIAGWLPTGQHFTLDISTLDDPWLSHLDDAYRSADESPAVQAVYNVPALAAHLKSQGIEAPEGFLQGLQSDAQANI